MNDSVKRVPHFRESGFVGLASARGRLSGPVCDALTVRRLKLALLWVLAWAVVASVGLFVALVNGRGSF